MATYRRPASLIGLTDYILPDWDDGAVGQVLAKKDADEMEWVSGSTTAGGTSVVHGAVNYTAAAQTVEDHIVGIDAAFGASARYTELVNLTANTPLAVQHNLGEQYPHVMVYDSTGNQVWLDVTATSSNTVTVESSSSATGLTVVVTAGRSPATTYIATGLTLTAAVPSTITHALDQQFVNVVVYNSANELVIVDVALVSSSQIALTSSVTLSNVKVFITK